MMQNLVVGRTFPERLFYFLGGTASGVESFVSPISKLQKKGIVITYCAVFIPLHIHCLLCLDVRLKKDSHPPSSCRQDVTEHEEDSRLDC